METFQGKAGKAKKSFCKKFCKELSDMRHKSPLNFWCMVAFLATCVIASTFFLTATIVGIMSHDNGWQLVGQSLHETFIASWWPW